MVRPQFCALCLSICGATIAGPPYVTDDPAPTDLGRWEIYQFVAGSHVAGSTGGESGIDLNYGGARDVQLTCVIPLAYEKTDTLHAGLGVVETAVKYRFLHQRDGGPALDVAFFPRVFWPTAAERFASSHVSVLLPLWAGRDFGSWSVFGGGGYQVNPGAGNLDYWLGGIAITRSFGERASLGAEMYHRATDAVDGRPLTAVNVGASWMLAEHWSLLLSMGPGVQNADEEMKYGFYVSLKADY